MGSTRLPGKVLREICERPMLWHVIERVKRVQRVDDIVLATSDQDGDDILVAYAERACDVAIFRGSEQDVLQRYYQAATAHSADIVIRITADCPLISPTVMDTVLDAFHRDMYDYVSNTMQRSFPHGLDVEIVPYRSLELAHNEATATADREHVMPFLWRQPERFHLANVAQETNHSDLRWTVDTEDDLRLVQRIYEHMYVDKPTFDWQDVLALLQQHPDWSDMNAHIQQKKYGE